MADVIAHGHNADRTRENGWAYWRCTGCGQLCHYVPTPPVPEVYSFCPCCTAAGTMPCLACGDPCLPPEHGEHIQTKHPACPVCLVIEGSALGTGCTCEAPAEVQIDATTSNSEPLRADGSDLPFRANGS